MGKSCPSFLLFLLPLFSPSLAQSNSGTDIINPSKSAVITRHLVLNGNYTVLWRVEEDSDSENSEIIFQLQVRTMGYVGLGISMNGAMNGADIVICKLSDDGTAVLEDRHGVGNVEPVLDDSQDWKLRSGRRNETHTIFEISRDLKTGDEAGDLEITVDTLRLIWAYGINDSKNLTYHGSENRGIVSVNFLDPAVETPSEEEMAKKYPVWKTQRKVFVSTNDTVYMCSFYKAPKVGGKHHIVGFGMHIDKPELKRHLHHADLYRCTAPPGVNPDEFFAPYMKDNYDCNYSQIPFPYENCGLFEFQWTIGGGITMFPDNLGMPIGHSDGSQEYYMTEVHFDNPRKRSDMVITAGFNIYYTPDLRETEVGHFQLGVMTNKTYSLTVPPNSTDFVVSSHCPMDCTSSIPPEGITVFTYLLHSHLSGRKLKVRHFRDEEELPLLAKDDNFDFGYQNNRRLRTPVKILPGDHLTIECTYDTNWKKGRVVIGGRAARDEMCQAFLLYYPRMLNINSCGSYNPHQRILDFMGLESVSQYQGEIDATVVSPTSLAGFKYSEIVEQRVVWSPENRERYQNAIRYGEQQAYCIPIHYHNETFVMTNYPTSVYIVEGRNSILTYSNLIIVCSIICLIGLIVGILIMISKRKQDGKDNGNEKPSKF